MVRFLLILLALFLVACGAKQASSDEKMHDPPDEEVIVDEKEETEPEVAKLEFPDAALRLVDETGKVRLHITTDGDVIAKGQTIGTLIDGKFVDAKGRVLMEAKKRELHSGGKKIGDFLKEDLGVFTSAGTIGLDGDGRMISHIIKGDEVYRSGWRFADLTEDTRRHAIIIAIAFQNQMQLKKEE